MKKKKKTTITTTTTTKNVYKTRCSGARKVMVRVSKRWFLSFVHSN